MIFSGFCGYVLLLVSYKSTYTFLNFLLLSLHPAVWTIDCYPPPPIDPALVRNETQNLNGNSSPQNYPVVSPHFENPFTVDY